MQRRNGTSSGWAGAAMGVHQDHIEGRLFVGTSGPDVITFVCLRDGTYAIARNGQIQQTWAAEAMDVCLAAFHRMIDRPREPDDEPLPPPNRNPPPFPTDDGSGPSAPLPTDA
jgi:hypothetical protein